MRYLRLLGPVSVTEIQTAQTEAQGAIVAPVPRFRSRRTMGLLGYLAAEGRPLSRDLLAVLFWPDETPSKGRANLSRELHNLAKILPDCWVQNRQSVAFSPAADTSVDLYQLRQLELEKQWQEAAGLLGGEFLEGLLLDHNHDFENWLLGERERWRGRAEKILHNVIEGHARRGRYSDGLREARRLLQWAPWDEATHRQIMRFLAWTGQRGRRCDGLKAANGRCAKNWKSIPLLRPLTSTSRSRLGHWTFPHNTLPFSAKRKRGAPLSGRRL